MELGWTEFKSPVSIRRMIGAVLFTPGLFLLYPKIGWDGVLGVFLIIFGFVISCGIKGYYGTTSQELKARQKMEAVEHQE